MIAAASSGNIKLADFGLATIYARDGQRLPLNRICGSPPYVAPEVAAGLAYDGAVVDMWSCGIILIVLLAGSTACAHGRAAGGSHLTGAPRPAWLACAHQTRHGTSP